MSYETIDNQHSASEKNTENQSNNGEATEEVMRKPIAVYDSNLKTMNSLIDINALNEKLSEACVTRSDADRYVVESVEVLDSVPHNKDVRGEIKITLLDTEEECSYSIWCMKSYVVKDVKEQQVDYYLDEDVENGNYDFAFKEGDNYYVADFIGDSLSIQEVDSLDYVTRPKFVFLCKSRNCGDDCDKAGSWYCSWCKRCKRPNGKCDEMGILGYLLESL